MLRTGYIPLWSVREELDYRIRAIEQCRMWGFRSRSGPRHGSWALSNPLD